MLSTAPLPNNQEEKIEDTLKLAIECKKLSAFDFSDSIISTITHFLESHTPLNNEIFQHILRALPNIPSDYPPNITAMFDALKKHPNLKTNTKMIYATLDSVLSDVSYISLHGIYQGHAKLINDIFLLNLEIYNNKEFLDKFIYSLMRYNVAEDCFAKKIIESVNFSIFSTQDLIKLLVAIIRINKFNSDKLIAKVFATDPNLLEKTTPQQNYILFKYAFRHHYFELVTKVAAFEFDPNTTLDHNIYSHEIKESGSEKALITFILDDSNSEYIGKCLHTLIQRGVDVFSLNKYIFGHPISTILEKKLLNEIKIYFDSPEKLQKAEHYLIIKGLSTGISNDVIKEEYQAFKDSSWLSNTFINSFEPMLVSGINLITINQLYPEFLDWWLKNLVMCTKNLSYFKRLPAKDFFAFTSQIFFIPELAKQFSPYLARLEYIYFGDGGKSNETWSQFATFVFKKSNLYKNSAWANLQPSLAPFFRNRQDLKLIPFTGEDKLHSRTSYLFSKHPIKSKRLKLEHSIIPGIKHLSSLDMFDTKNNSWKFHKILGRTIQMKNTQGDILAFKLQKRREKLCELQKEYATTNYLRKHAKTMKLQSAIHRPEAMCVIDDARMLLLSEACVNPEQLNTLMQLVNLDKPICAYIYSVKQKDTGCFTYLHDICISDSELALANRIAINDLIQLFKYGFYYHQLADMFHANQENAPDRYDNCRYRTLVNVINKTFYGKGKVDRWLLATEYLNIRKTGLVDLGDWVPVGDLFDPNNDFTFNNYCVPSSSMSEVRRATPDENIGNISAMNSIAEYLMVLELCLGRRGRELTEKALSESTSEQNIKQIWLGLAKQMMTNTAQAIAIFCNLPEFKISEALHAWIDVNQYAEQMEFWMTKKYIPYINEDKPFPKSLYGEHTQAVSVRSRYTTGMFSIELGFTTNGKDPDLGLMSSQNPVKKGDELMYVAAMMMSSFTNQHEFDMEKLKTSIDHISRKLYTEAECYLRKISGCFPQRPRLNVKAIKIINQHLQAGGLFKTLETSLLKQKEIHSNQIEKYYAYKWLSLYKTKKSTRAIEEKTIPLAITQSRKSTV